MSLVLKLRLGLPATRKLRFSEKPAASSATTLSTGATLAQIVSYFAPIRAQLSQQTIAAAHGDQAVVRGRGQRVERPAEVHRRAHARRRALLHHAGAAQVILSAFSANPSVEVGSHSTIGGN